MRFARLLRGAGLPIGPACVLEALRALGAVDLGRRDDVYWALSASLVRDPGHRAVFDQAFRLFFRPPSLPLPLLPASRLPRPAPELSRRVVEAWAALSPGARPPPPPREPPVEHDAALSYAPDEVLRRKDFEQMSADEARRARRLVARLRFEAAEVPVRRLRPDPRGPRVDLRATMRASARAGGELAPFKRRGPARRPPPLVVIGDVSGSMGRYTEMLLRFAHAAALAGGRRVHCFLFGTRLTDVTRALRRRDPDAALAACARAVADWSGGTRIRACLREFNRRWSRRVLGQRAWVLLVTDGLDRDPALGLADEAARLRRSCGRLVWLNPLLRYRGFEPKAAGVRALLPEVDEMRAVHDVTSLEALADALGGAGRRGRGRGGAGQGGRGPRGRSGEGGAGPSAGRAAARLSGSGGRR
ncbi:MAG TPA: VWA domain-containing protein [Polyangiaceae bacterium]|nr:VWA domain-containing protein [Polyangiaceae bacterium]